MNREQLTELRKAAEEARTYPWAEITEELQFSEVTTKAEVSFVTAANPSTILSLLDHVERLEKDGPQMARGRDAKGNSVTAPMRVVLHDYMMAADAEAKLANELAEQVKSLERDLEDTEKLVVTVAKQRDDLLEALDYAIKQVPELGTVPGIAAAIASVKESK